MASAILPIALAQDGATVIDAGGGRSTVDNVVSEASVGGIVGGSSSDAPGTVIKAGFFGQIYEVTNLVIRATPSALIAGQSCQLSGMAQLDDGTMLVLSGSDLLWDEPAPPIASISPTGVATAAGVSSQQPGSVTGSYRGVRASAVIMVYPGVTTLAATEVMADGTNVTATLNGLVNPSGLATTAWFEWGTDTSYGEATPLLAIGPGTNTVPFTAPLTGLAAGVVYHFRAVATNALGLATGVDLVLGLNTIPVTTLADAGPGSLRQAVADAGAGFTITFGVTGTIVLTSGELVIGKDLTFAGPGAANLTLSGNHASRIFNVLPVNVQLAGLTLANGRAPSGGAVFSQGRLSIGDCVFEGNEATSDRGGAIAAGGPLQARNSTFSANRAVNGGGAIDTRYLDLDIADCTFTANQADRGGAIAAGLTVPASPITISGLGRTSTYSDVDLNGTRSPVAMVAPGAPVTFKAHYTSAYIPGGGGCPGCITQHYLGINGVFADCHGAGYGSGLIDRSFTAPTAPGVYYITQTPTWWYYCDQFGIPGFYNGPENAVAVLIVGPPASPIVNTTFSGNSAVMRGGALVIDEPARFELVNCTLTRNGAILGGAVFVPEAPGTLQLLNNIVAGNGADFGPDINGSVTSQGHNLIGDAANIGGLVATDVIGVDPQLGPLQDNGGPTQTHALLIGSPAIDAGDAAVEASTDQRGLPRLSGATVSPLVDIGAYELQFPSLSPVPDQPMLEDGWLGPIPFTVSDAEWPAASLVVQAFASNPSLLAADGITLAGEGGTRSIQLQPLPDQWGETMVTLRVANPLGAASSNQFKLTVLSVNDLPSFTLSTNRIEAPINGGPEVIPGVALNITPGPPDESGQAVDFRVLANDNPTLFASGGAPELTPTGTLKFTPGEGRFGSANLTVVLHDDGGTANGGLDTSGTNLLVIDIVTPPIITGQPLSQTNQAGATVYFQVVADANPTPAYQWLFEGLPIQGATASVLSLPNVQASKAGKYQVLVSNRVGRVLSAPALLGVTPLQQAPGIIQEPADQQLARGGTLVLSVGSVGSDPLAYQWRRNGVNLQSVYSADAADSLLAHGSFESATNSTLIITNFQPADAGSYSVVVLNGLGTVESRRALVALAAEALSYSDAFAGPRQPLAVNGGIGVAQTLGFTFEPGEPLHAGRTGGSSAWFDWVAPFDGLATFTTAGSAFDTLLAVYEGGQVDRLTPKESDDDGGGSFTSFLRFNARAGGTYRIAVDDRSGVGGNVVLGWRFDVNLRVPVILTQPASRVVTNWDQSVLYSVVLQDTNNLRYQWRRDGRNLTDNDHHRGTASPELTILRQLGAEDVGLYTVVVTNSAFAGPALASEPAILEIAIGNINTNIPSQDKFEDLLASVRLNHRPGPRGGHLHSGGSASVSAGTIISDNFRSRTEAAERSIAGVIGGASRWYHLPLMENGLFTVQTTGSGFDTVLAIYTTANFDPTNTLANLKYLVGDDNSAPDGTNALVRFLGQTNLHYFAAVDGRFGANGIVKLDWRSSPGPPPDASRWFVCQPNTNGVLVVDTALSGIGKVYFVYTGTDYSNLADVPFAIDEETRKVSFPVVQGRNYVVLADGAHGDPNAIRPMWQVYPLDELVINPRGRTVQLQWVHPGLRLQSATSVNGPWFDFGVPAYTDDGQIIAPLPPAAPLQLFRLAPPR